MKYPYYISGRVRCSTYLRLTALSLINNIALSFSGSVKTYIDQCFVVGCGHSGTTLVTAKLGRHRDVCVVPRETNAFMPQFGPGEVQNNIDEWISITELEGARCFIEKTPKHVHAINRMKMYLPNATVFGVFRDPLNNCASLTRRFKDVDYSIERWCMDNRALLQSTLENKVNLVSYNFLAQNPEITFAWLLHKLNLSFDNEILGNGGTPYDCERHESYNMRIRTEQVRQPIYYDANAWTQVLSASQGKKVERKTRRLFASLEEQFETSEREIRTLTS